MRRFVGAEVDAAMSGPETAAEIDETQLRVTLLDADGHDREISEDELDASSISDHRLVWIDLPLASGERDGTRARAILERLGVPAQVIPPLLQVSGRPRLFEHENFMRLEVTGLRSAETEEASEPVAVLCVAGPNWLVTAHDARVDFLEAFHERASGDSDLGTLDAAAFLAAVLEWQVASYDGEIERIVELIDQLENEALRGDSSRQQTLEHLVALRRRISGLRSLLAPHQHVFTQLARPEFDRLSTSASAEAFRTLVDRTSASIETVDRAREMLLGSFEIMMTRTAQRTNDVMKQLTVLTVLLLPSTLTAGILGMNFHPTFFDRPALFWVAVGFMAVTMTATLITIRRRGWLS